MSHQNRAKIKSAVSSAPDDTHRSQLMPGGRRSRPGRPQTERDPEKWTPVFRKDHAPSRYRASSDDLRVREPTKTIRGALALFSRRKLLRQIPRSIGSISLRISAPRRGKSIQSTKIRQSCLEYRAADERIRRSLDSPRNKIAAVQPRAGPHKTSSKCPVCSDSNCAENCFLSARDERQQTFFDDESKE
jgi:hypothetical protein